MLDLNSLESLVIASETLSFTETAERRNTVQSAVSAHIRKLETEIGKPLFERGRGQQMSLTPDGQALTTYARRILSLTDEAVSTVKSGSFRSILKLGTTVSLAQSVLPRVLRRYSELEPDIQIHIACDRSNALLHRMDKGEVEIVLMHDQGKTASRVFAESTPLVWAGSTDFMPGSRPEVPLVFLTDGRDLRRQAFEALDSVGRAGFIAHQSPDPTGLRAFVLAGLALTVMARPAVAAPLRLFGSDEGLPALAPSVLSLYRSMRYPSKEIDTLVQLLREEIRSQSREST
ncbi:LysR family transcriptional regulator [Roseibium sp.]|uniref:LysR family transcriptional regulator n=1 Tax=Roseibium sp. TaxID=1936156 RepID=UPI003B501F0D